MKKLFILIFLTLGLSVQADLIPSNQECVNVYREGYLDLKQMVSDFNHEYYNRLQFATLVAANSTAVGTFRAACLAVESPSNTKCVESYKEIYKDLRTQIKLMSILSGNQTKVAYSAKMQSLVEKDRVEKKPKTILGKLGRFLKIGGGTIVEIIERTKQITILEFVDNKCL